MELNEVELKVIAMGAEVLGKFDLVRERFLSDKGEVDRVLWAFRDWKKLRDELLLPARSGGKDTIDALKITDRGWVKVRLHPAAPAADLSRSGLDYMRTIGFTVEDTGIGIPEDKQALIFEAFQQADGGTSGQYGGTELGLAVALGAVRTPQGAIAVESESGRGSTFRVFWPIAE
jgi:hypothetical protein